MRKLLVMIFLTLAAVSASAAEQKETIDRTYDVHPGARLSVDNVNGRVTVTSWDQPRIRVHAEKTASGWDSEDVRTALREVKVDIQARPDGVSVKTVEPDKSFGFLDFLLGHHVNRAVTYEITVPRATNLDLETVNGSVHVSEVSGTLKLDTTNGKIDVSRCAGTVDASTTNGGIHAELLSVTPGKTMRFETTNGHITIVVPPSLATEVDASTTNGRISTDLPVTTRSADHNTLHGTVNGGGGGMLRLRTTNGGIDIKTTTTRG
jgi:DUF4097 and DUF4098 domain-containing protein YvlB